jgi:hypothetical protein
VQLTDILGGSQQTITAHEVGPRRIQVSALPVNTQALSVAMETLAGEAPTATRNRAPAPKLQQHIDRSTQLPKPRQKFAIQVIESPSAQSAR